MTPKEKARDLYEKMYDKVEDIVSDSWIEGRHICSKQCALIAVGEIIDCLSKYTGMHDQEFFDADLFYYKEVKEEIEKL